MTSSIQTYDVAIAGGGPAGSSAALKLAEQGLKVALIEKTLHPRYKTCGGGIVQRAFKYLPVDVSKAIENNCHTIEFNLNNSKQHFHFTSCKPIVSMTMRNNFDELLLSAACEAGANIITECEVKDVQTNSNNINIRTNNGSISSKYLIAADGALSVVANKAGWKETRYIIPALEYEVYVDDNTLESFSKSARFDFDILPDGYAWVFPKKDHLSIGILSMNRKRTIFADIFTNYLKLLRIKTYSKIEKHGFIIPVHPRKDTFMKNRVLLTGDVAGFADPVTAEGISFAILSGQIAANAIIKGDMEESLVHAHFHNELDQKILSELRIGRILSKLVYMNPVIRTNLFRFYGHKFTKSMTHIFLGKKSYKDIVRNPLNYLKLLRMWNPGNNSTD